MDGRDAVRAESDEFRSPLQFDAPAPPNLPMRKSGAWEPMPLRGPLGDPAALRVRAWVRVCDNAA